MKRIVFLFLFCSLFANLTAQELTQSYLEGLRDEELLELYDTVENDSVNAEMVVRAYLDRARKEGDTIKMARGYDRLARIFHPEKNIAFADSIIDLTGDFKNITYPALAYLIKGVEYNEINDFINASQNFYHAYELSKENDNLLHLLFVYQNLIHYKLFWGDPEGALELQQERHSLLCSKGYEEKLKKTLRKGYTRDVKETILENQAASSFTYANCFLQLRKLDSASKYIDQFQALTNKYEGFRKEAFLDLLLEIKLEYYYYKKKPSKVEEIFHEHLPKLKSDNDLSSLFDLYSFYGYSLIENARKNKGETILLKADSIYNAQETNLKMIPYRSRVFKELYEYYAEKDDKHKQIMYLTKLIKLDSLFKKNIEYFGPEHIRRFETPKLLEEKEQLIDSLEQKEKRNTYLQWGGGAVLLTAFGFLGYYYRRQRRFQHRFEALVQAQNEEVNPEAPKNTADSLEIDAEIVTQILMGLEKLEKKKGFVDTKITLNTLAKRLNTNANYLSRVINYKKGKGFSQYLSDLRLEYCITELLPQELYRKFTIKAIAVECGFKNGESFSRSFYKKYGVYPSYYIKEMEKKES